MTTATKPKAIGRKCESEWPLLDRKGDAMLWWPCEKRGEHRVCESHGIVYDSCQNEAEIRLRWRTA